MSMHNSNDVSYTVETTIFFVIACQKSYLELDKVEKILIDLLNCD